MKKHPFCGARTSINIVFFISPLHPELFRKCSQVDFRNTNVYRETRSTVLSVFFRLVSTPIQYLYLCRDIIFSFVLVHNQLRRVVNYYIMVYIIKKHNSTGTSVFKCSKLLFSSFCLTSQ